MFRLLPVLLASAGCDREPPSPEAYLDASSPEGKALEAAFCRDAGEGLAMLAEVGDPGMRDFILYKMAQQHPRGAYLLLPHFKDEEMRRSCWDFYIRPHLWADEGFLTDAEVCPALSGWDSPKEEMGCGVCFGDWKPDPRKAVVFTARIPTSYALIAVELEEAREAVEKSLAKGEEWVKLCSSYVPPDCPCPSGTLTLQATYKNKRIQELSVQGGSLRAAGSFLHCFQSLFGSRLRPPADTSGSFTVEYRLRPPP